METEAVRVKNEEKVAGFFADRYNLAFVAVIVFAFAIRLYYFLLTKNQALWFDETEYLGMAKHWVFNTYAIMNPQRVPVMPLVAAIIYKIGGTTAAVKFFTSVLPSTGIVAMFYFLGGKMYGKKIALFASVIAAVFWVTLFWTNRINTDMLAFLFVLIALYFTWSGYVLKENERHARYALPVFVLSFLTKPNMAIVIIVAAAFLLFYSGLEPLRKKAFWMSWLLSLLIVIPFLVWQKIQYGSFLAFRSATHILAKGTEFQISYKPPAWYVFNYVYTFPESVLFWAAALGLALFIFYLFIGRDLIKKDKVLAANLFLITLLSVSLAYFVFIERDAEDRWILPIALPLFYAASSALAQIQQWIQKAVMQFGRHAALATVVFLLASGAYVQLSHADSIIKLKMGTYSQEPAAGMWLKDHTSPNDLIIANNEHVPFVFYSERRVDGVSIFESREKLKDLMPKYYVVTAYYNSPAWTYELPQKYPSSLLPVQVFYENRGGQKMPAIVIYEFKGYDF